MLKAIVSILHYAWIVLIVDLVIVGSLASFIWVQVSVLGKSFAFGLH